MLKDARGQGVQSDTNDSDPVARIHRLIRAIGDGPHAFTFNRWEHLRGVLRTIGDQQAIRLVSKPPSRQGRR